MNIFKKLFGKKKRKAEEKKPECWYNNAHEQPAPLWSAPSDPGSPWSDNSVDNNTTMSMAKR